MNRFYLISILIILLQSIIFSQNLRIDHVITVVNDLDSAIKVFEKGGFTLKPGRLHKNGLINAHIKFSNGSFFEIMSLQGEAKDDIAKSYEALLKEGEGGVYIALSGLSTKQYTKKLKDLNLEYDVIKNKQWDYIIIPKIPHIFFIDYHTVITEKEEFCIHTNTSVGIHTVFIRKNEDLINLFKAFNLHPEDDNQSFLLGLKVFQTQTGRIIMTNSKNTEKRPRILSVFFGNDKNKEVEKIYW